MTSDTTATVASVPAMPALIYAIGDVHGCLDQLRTLEAQIVADAAHVDGEKWLVCLGDYVDRGPDSAGVIEHLLTPPPSGFRRFCLRGNHEAAMLAAVTTLGGMADWLSFGGDATLRSYGMTESGIASLVDDPDPEARLALLRAHVPNRHLAFLRGLGSILSVPGYIFVHAGLRPGVRLDAQVEEDTLWIRNPFLNAPHNHGGVVVHGHTPVRAPVLLHYRIGIDTGCYMTGILTAARLEARGGVSFLSTSG